MGISGPLPAVVDLGPGDDEFDVRGSGRRTPAGAHALHGGRRRSGRALTAHAASVDLGPGDDDFYVGNADREQITGAFAVNGGLGRRRADAHRRRSAVEPIDWVCGAGRDTVWAGPRDPVGEGVRARTSPGWSSARHASGAVARGRLAITCRRRSRAPATAHDPRSRAQRVPTRRRRERPLPRAGGRREAHPAAAPVRSLRVEAAITSAHARRAHRWSSARRSHHQSPPAVHERLPLEDRLDGDAPAPPAARTLYGERCRPSCGEPAVRSPAEPSRLEPVAARHPRGTRDTLARPVASSPASSPPGASTSATTSARS